MRARRPADRDLPGHGLDALIGIDPGARLAATRWPGTLLARANFHSSEMIDS